MENELRQMFEAKGPEMRVPSTLSPELRKRVGRQRMVLGGLVAAAALVMVIGGFAAASSLTRDDALPPVDPDPKNVFVDTWVSIDADGSTQTMVVRASGEGAFDVLLKDDGATVCSGAPATITGTARLDGPRELVIPTPALTCDDGSEPKAVSGPPLDEQIRNMTFKHDRETDTLVDNGDVVWGRGEIPPGSGGMWPQSSLEEIREAQEFADAGDPRYTWQLDPELAAQEDPYEAEIFARFLQEELGWEKFQSPGGFAGYVYDENGGSYGDVVFIRCAPGRTNPLYPNDPQGRECAPTIDELHYETVAIDVAQLDHRGPAGIWVVTGWTTPPPSDAPITPYSDPFGRQVEQVVPPTDADATGLLEAFLQARIDGEGAQEYLHSTYTPVDEIPLLYATSSGAPYERYEIGRQEGPVWPIGNLMVKVRLFAEGGNTVVEQPFYMYREGDGRLGLEYLGEGTTENGDVVPEPSSILDGQVTYYTGPDWAEISNVPELGYLQSRGLGNGAYAHIEILPNSLAPDCDTSGGSPPSAEELVRAIRSDPDLDTTAPVPARVGGIDALQLDVAPAPGAATCGGSTVQVAPSPYEEGGGHIDPGDLGRIYVLDLPEPLRAPARPGPDEDVRTLTILILVGSTDGDPEGAFDRAVASAAPILESFEFHAK
jgi:hypothetical protein